MMDNSLLIKAFRGIKESRPPVWFMRQAGRFLPEYRELRKKHSMLDVIRTPELAVEVTLQPVRRLGVDGAIIFADILTPLIGMGVELDFVEGEGPRIFNPVRDDVDVERLVVPPPEENVQYTLDAIRGVVSKLAPLGVPLIGFSGAPFTLSCYLIEGKSSPFARKATQFMLTYPKAWKTLQEKLAILVSEYLVAQADAGASALQIFDSWLGVLGPPEYDRFVAPYLKQIVASVKEKTDAPVIFFATSTAGIMRELTDLGADVLGVDWRISLRAAAELTGGNIPLQGNLDPNVLAGPWTYLADRVRSIIEEGKELPAHIFNLGHGILPHTPTANVEKVVELVRSY